MNASPTILIIDDHSDVRAVTGHMLKALGYGVLQAATASGALELVAAHRAAIAGILLDASLGEDDSGTLLRELRGQTPVPVILMSGHDAADLEPLLGRIDTFLPKPFALSELKATIAAVALRPPVRA